MKAELQRQLVQIARRALADSHDPAHDFNHALNVMRNAEAIGEAEEADPDITVPAALFHDIVHYLPNDDRSDRAPQLSATFAEGVLRTLDDYPAGKVPAVREAILSHSAWLPFETASLEAKVVRDADLLEATGALALMRTFACAGVMNLALYSPDDPLCASRTPNRLQFALDYASTRMVEVPARQQTETARRMADERDQFLAFFLVQIRAELGLEPAQPASGSRTANTLPAPGAERSTTTVPPLSSASSRQMASPSPVPGGNQPAAASSMR